MSVAHALLCPANALAATLLPSRTLEPSADFNVLPIEEVIMPAGDVSDLKDVFEAINRLCETMRTSTYDDVAEDQSMTDDVDDVNDTMRSSAVSLAETICVADSVQVIECDEGLVSPTEVSIQTVEAYRADRWSDALVSPPNDETDTIPSDTEPAVAACEPASEMYYTASSEVSLLSDLELPEKPVDDETKPDEVKDKDERKECVIAGHVAAMRERFESMTRCGTPAAELALDGRNVTPSPDSLG